MDSMKKIKVRKEWSTTKKIVMGFLFAIIIGTVLLSLPVASVDGNTDILTSLFTATTSICVTGLVVVDTFAHWTLFGKIVILCLIQLGGMGIVVFTSAILMMLHRKVSLKSRMTIQDAFGLDSLKGMVKFVKKVICGTFIVEGLGALIYMIEFIPKYGVAKGIWFSVFTAISAFCNAGIDIMGSDSLMGYSSSPVVLWNSMFLITAGGLGFVVWWDVVNKIKLVFKKKLRLRDLFRRLEIHSKLVICMSLALVLTGAVLTFLFEYDNPNTIGDMSLLDKIQNSIFQSVTYRTAGFASIDQAGLKDPSAFMGIFLMLIGGSPVGTAGGMKTVTVAVIFLSVLSTVKGRNQTMLFKKSVNETLVRRSLAVAFIMISIFFVMNTLLMLSNSVGLLDSSFETCSAIATVGLTRGLTPNLNDIGKIIIIICMYLGRIGPISLFIALSNKYSVKNTMHYSEAKLYVG